MRFVVNSLAFFLVALVVSLAVGTISFLGYAMEDDSFVLQRPISVLVVGVDTEKGYRGRADTIMVIMMNPVSLRVGAMSIYRDALIPYEESALPASTLYARKGMGALRAGLTTLLGIKIDHFVAINFSAFRKAVDLVGGITVEVPYDMHREDRDPNRKIDLKKGVQVLDGRKALMMVRYRKEPLEDLERVKNQKTIARAILEKVLRKKNFFMIPLWYREIRNDIQTDLDEHGLWTLAGLLYRVPLEKWAWESLPGTVTESGRFAPDVEKTRERVSHLYRATE